MASPQTITGLTLLKLGNLSYATLVVEDANGNLAMGTTPMYQTPNGLLVPGRADALGTQLTTSRITTELTSTALAASAVYTQGWQDAQMLAVSYVAGSVTADQAGTLAVNFSDDGVHVAQSVPLLAFSPATAGTANAQAIAYPIQISTRYFRFVYTNGATAQGTFALYQTPMNAWQPTHNLPPLATITPSLIATIPYSDFTTASSSYYQYLPATMHRHARARSILLTNTMNESLTSVGFFPYDSDTAEGTPSGVGGGFTWGSGPGSGGGVMTLTSEQASQGGAGALATHVDSFQIGLGMGATLPTSGDVYIHLTELL